MTRSRSKFTAADLISGKTYHGIRIFEDYDGAIHSIGERWRFVDKNFLPTRMD